MRRGRHKVAVATGDQPSPVDALRIARREADEERMDAVRARVDAEDRRRLAVKAEDEGALARIDDEIAAARRRIDIAEARFNRVDLETRHAEHDSEQDRRHAVRAKGERALTEARELMRAEYPTAALAVVDVLKRARELQEVARLANLELPDDAAPLSLIVDPSHDAAGVSRLPPPMEWRSVLVHRETGKPAPSTAFSGPEYEFREMLMPKPMADPLATTFKAIADYVNLPGIEPDRYFYGAVRWGQAR